MKKLIFSLFSMLILINGFAQDCHVLDTNIAGTYVGKCKKGLAHGEGESKGTDSYKGIFKKGMKHKNGTYTYANGNQYIGAFENDKMHGEGIYTEKEGGIKKGYWKNGKYVGKEESDFLGYKIYAHTNIPTKPSFRKVGEEMNKIEIKIVDINQDIIGYDISNYGKCNIGDIHKKYITHSSGIKTVSELKAVLLDVEYPFNATITYRVPNKSNTFQLDCTLNFVITESGYWKVSITHN